MASKLFPTDLEELKWLEFSADSFARPVCGIVYRAGQAVCGMPLGGIGTGCLDLNTDGTLGYSSVFNTFAPPTALNVPFLALAVGDKVWALAQSAVPGTEPARRISYFGHYPVADVEFDADGPVSVGLRAWSPFVPGDSALSNTPGAIFELRLRNTTGEAQKGCVAFSFPGPSSEEAGRDTYERKELTGEVQGVEVMAPKASYALGVMGGPKPRVGGGLSAEKGDWAKIASALPAASESDAGATLAVDFSLKPAEEKTVHLVLAWYAPRWEASFYHHYLHAYTERFDHTCKVAEFLAREHGALLKRILAWQEVIYSADELPVWLREQLVNILHTIPQSAFWASNLIPREDWCVPGGIFGMAENPRVDPHVCIPSDWYGGFPFIFFFPDLFRSVLRAYAHFQLPNGEIPLGLGWGANLTAPIYHFLHTTSAPNFVDVVYRLWLRTHDQTVLSEFYPSVKKAIEYAQSLDRDADGLLDLDPEPTGNQFYGAWAWVGTATHTDGMWLGALRMAERMGEAMGDAAFVHDCRVWLERGNQSLEEKLWAEGCYLLYHDTATGRKSDTILADQLAGQWMAYLTGLPNVFPPERVKTTLETVKRMNIPATKLGAMNAIRPDGSIDPTGPRHSTEIFPGENIVVALTLIYAGDRKAGEEVAYRAMENIVMRQRLGWDMPNIVDPETGKVTHGRNFYQMIVIWGLPLAMAGQDISAACAPGGLVDRILQAARA